MIELRSDTAVVLLAKAPIPGQVKTRFTPPCSPDDAATFARAFLQDTAHMLTRFAGVDRYCSYFGPVAELEDLLDAELLLQRGNGLGERIANVSLDLFASGYRRVVVLCADCPTVSQEYMQQALDRLDDHDLVFGPARDGGCVLVGLAKPATSIFSNVPMSTDHVYDDMITESRALGCSSATLSVRFDLDYLQDLQDAIEEGELDHATNTRSAYLNFCSSRRIDFGAADSLSKEFTQ